MDKLKVYKSKRNFKVTKEPKSNNKARSREPLFVIQKHDATNLHYDFRLEVDGVLASWAVPKGPSTDKKDKRLAVRTEDHPMSYADFEGTIPEGEYGGGTVMVWDYGTYENITEKNGEIRSMAENLDKGHLLINIKGEKLRGGYALTRMRKGKSEQWLLVKMDDDTVDPEHQPVDMQPDSVKTGRSLEEIAADSK